MSDYAEVHLALVVDTALALLVIARLGVPLARHDDEFVQMLGSLSAQFAQALVLEHFLRIFRANILLREFAADFNPAPVGKRDRTRANHRGEIFFYGFAVVPVERIRTVQQHILHAILCLPHGMTSPGSAPQQFVRPAQKLVPCLRIDDILGVFGGMLVFALAEERHHRRVAPVRVQRLVFLPGVFDLRVRPPAEDGVVSAEKPRELVQSHCGRDIPGFLFGGFKISRLHVQFAYQEVFVEGLSAVQNELCEDAPGLVDKFFKVRTVAEFVCVRLGVDLHVFVHYRIPHLLRDGIPGAPFVKSVRQRHDSRRRTHAVSGD